MLGRGDQQQLLSLETRQKTKTKNKNHRVIAYFGNVRVHVVARGLVAWSERVPGGSVEP